MRGNRVGAERLIPAVAIALVTVGILMVYSNSAILAERDYGDAKFFLRKHLLFATLGVALMFVFSRMRYYALRKLAYPALAVSAIALGLVLVPGIGIKSGGARRWLDLALFSFQPAEFAKIAIVLYMAHSLTKKEEKIKTFRVGFFPHIIVTSMLVLLVLAQPDFGSAVAMATLVFLILFIAGARITYIITCILGLLPLLWYLIMSAEYRRQRIAAFLDPWEHASSSGFQVIQSFYAFGVGGLAGRGLGDGRQKLFYLPEAHTDFIFSAIGEELGFVGVMGIVILFFILISLGFSVAFRTAEPFGAFLAAGITAFLGLQVTINMAVVLGLLPTKGLTLPFISYGGTSLVASLIGVGILTGVAGQANRWGSQRRSP